MEEHAALGPPTEDEDEGAWGILTVLGAVVLGGAIAYLLIRARNQRRDPIHEANRIVTRAHEKVSELERFIGDLRRAWETLDA